MLNLNSSTENSTCIKERIVLWYYYYQHYYYHLVNIIIIGADIRIRCRLSLQVQMMMIDDWWWWWRRRRRWWWWWKHPIVGIGSVHNLCSLKLFGRWHIKPYICMYPEEIIAEYLKHTNIFYFRRLKIYCPTSGSAKTRNEWFSIPLYAVFERIYPWSKIGLALTRTIDLGCAANSSNSSHYIRHCNNLWTHLCRKKYINNRWNV